MCSLCGSACPYHQLRKQLLILEKPQEVPRLLILTRSFSFELSLSSTLSKGCCQASRAKTAVIQPWSTADLSISLHPRAQHTYEHGDGGQGIWLGLWKVGFDVFPELKSLRQEQGGLVHSFFTIKLILPQSRCPTGTSCFLFSALVYS